jgi:glycosyltransferase involved in cell wall biosynthesis
VTIITSTLNAEGTIKNLIGSLRAQSTNNFEWVVADGGSTDQTLAILQEYKDVVTRVLPGPDFGIYDGLNRAISTVRTPYYLVVGADDTLDPNAICVSTKAAKSSKSDFISGHVKTSDGRTLLPSRGNAVRYGHLAYVSQHSVGTLIKTDLHKEVGLYSNRFPIAADRHFILNAIEHHGASVEVLDTTMGTYAMTGTSSTQLHNTLLDMFKVDYELSKHPLVSVLKSILRYALYIPRLARRR